MQKNRFISFFSQLSRCIKVSVMNIFPYANVATLGSVSRVGCDILKQKILKITEGMHFKNAKIKWLSFFIYLFSWSLFTTQFHGTFSWKGFI